MRQFVFLILVAVALWWGYGQLGGESAASGGAAPAAPAAGGGRIADVLQQAPAQPGTEVPLTAPQAAPPPPPAAPPADCEELLAAIARQEAGAAARGWAALADQGGLSGEPRRRLAAALAPATEDFPALLGQLGTGNVFLHSREGRALAERALGAAMAMPDPEAVAAGTRLLDLAVRGRIDKQDHGARGFVDEAYRQHRLRVDRWLCNPANVQGARSYTVARGDVLARIAARFRREKILVEDGTLAVLNGIRNPDALMVGQRLKVPLDPIHCVVEKRSFSLAVYVGPSLLRLYWIGHGEHDKTPVAEFTVAEKVEKPQWTAPDGNVWPYGHPNNILGEYYVTLQHPGHDGFGVHGTPMPETIGTMSSMGCIRMHAPDIAELFRLLPRGTKFVVRASGSS